MSIEVTPIMRQQLKDAGWVILREKSYRQAQERQRVAEALFESAERDRESAYVWARECCAEERRLGARLAVVFAAAASLGVTTRQLAEVANGIHDTDAAPSSWTGGG